MGQLSTVAATAVWAVLVDLKLLSFLVTMSFVDRSTDSQFSSWAVTDDGHMDGAASCASGATWTGGLSGGCTCQRASKYELLMHVAETA